MSKYGYISLDMLYEYAMNTVDKTVSPNDFMRMPRANVIPIEWIKKWLETCIPRYDYDRMTYIADVYEMLEDWEEENGAKESNRDI